MTPSSLTSSSISPSSTAITITQVESTKTHVTSKLKSTIPTLVPISTSIPQSRATSSSYSSSNHHSQNPHHHHHQHHQQEQEQQQQQLLASSLSATRKSPFHYLTRLLKLWRYFALPFPLRAHRSVISVLVLSVLITFLVYAFNLPDFPTHTIQSWWLVQRAIADFRNCMYTLRRSARRLLHLYQRQLHLHPLSSRAITAGFIYLYADSIAQFLNRPRRKHFITTYSMKRTIRYSGYGLLIMGPFLYMWYDAMHRYGPADDFRGALMKAGFETFTLEPLSIVMYILYDALLCRRTYRFVKQSFRTRLLPLWLSNSIFWLPANFANYYVGTPDMRVIFANLCSLFWNIYFSAIVNRWHHLPPNSSSPPNSASSSASSNLHPNSKKTLPV